MMKALAAGAALALSALPMTAQASDDGVELWFNPSVSVDLDQNTGVEIETAQRLRDAGDGRPDTYFARLWLNQKVADTITLSGAIERRINDSGADETRLIQQMSTRHGILRTRFRMEQRLVDNADRMGLRLRPRLGVSVPLQQDGAWSLKGDAELFLTLRSTSVGGDDGLTGLRTQLGVGYDVSDRLSLSLAYLRQQDITPGRPDRIGHAPIIGIEFGF